MRTKRIIAATVAAAVVGAGVVATPMVLAAADDTDDTGDQTGSTDHTARGWGMQERWGDGQPGRGEGFGMQRGMGRGGMQGMGPGGQGWGPGSQGWGPGSQGMHGEGDCLLDEDGTAAGTLDGADERTLLAQVEHEKVARDVYAAFFDETGDYRFERVAQSEQHHLDALRMLLDRYDLADPTEGLDEGEFKTPAVQEQYEAYLEQGSDLEGALAAARDIETEDIADLRSAAKALDDAPDVERVYEQQVWASERHLEVFSR